MLIAHGAGWESSAERTAREAHDVRAEREASAIEQQAEIRRLHQAIRDE